MSQLNPPPLEVVESSTTNPTLAWFCVRTQPKHENIAAAHLRRHEQVDVVCPQVRYCRGSSQKGVCVVEAMFPGYLFAKFDWRTALKRVQHAPGVSGVVHFGPRWPVLPAEFVEELRHITDWEDARIPVAPPHVGEEVQLAAGAFEGLRAVVTRVMPGSQRVAVLLHFLGQLSSVDVPWSEISR